MGTVVGGFVPAQGAGFGAAELGATLDLLTDFWAAGPAIEEAEAVGFCTTLVAASATGAPLAATGLPRVVDGLPTATAALAVGAITGAGKCIGTEAGF